MVAFVGMNGLIFTIAFFLKPVFCAYMCPLRIIYYPPGVTTTFEWITADIFQKSINLLWWITEKNRFGELRF
jgi:polyferredoxin